MVRSNSVREKRGPGRGGPGARQVIPKSPVPQVNRFNKSRDRALLLTDRHVYKLDPGRQYRVMRALPLEAVSPGGAGEVGTSAGPLHSRLPGKARAFQNSASAQDGGAFLLLRGGRGPSPGPLFPTYMAARGCPARPRDWLQCAALSSWGPCNRVGGPSGAPATPGGRLDVTEGNQTAQRPGRTSTLKRNSRATGEGGAGLEASIENIPSRPGASSPKRRIGQPSLLRAELERGKGDPEGAGWGLREAVGGGPRPGDLGGGEEGLPLP